MRLRLPPVKSIGDGWQRQAEFSELADGGGACAGARGSVGCEIEPAVRGTHPTERNGP